MIFRRPVTFQEALDARRVKAILPTTGGTSDLDLVAPELRERAFFSARTANYDHLTRLNDIIARLVDPDYVTDPATGERRPRRPGEGMDPALARMAVRESLASIGYDPAAAGVKPGSLQDLGSDARIRVILDTNIRQARGYGQFAQGQSEAVLDQWPAQELIRAEARATQRDWAARWRAAGGTFHGGRMVALKNDPIWSAISRFNLPYPPFDYFSGMGLQDVDRDEAERLGLIDRDTQVPPQDRNFNATLQAALPDPQANTAALLDALQSSLGPAIQITGNTLKFIS
jgi:hypothetical protein